ncbi:MAG: hypothetical protein AW09_001307 [Candidatus Accumulibacter phosphatis]|uniref:Uncharacterized protein n=1 Tax=Candidatus Accumulibacter phosphatis TaxID=327160 RepID=A0A080LX74_9PROT|nr:MAG: hypothetical protein AW09_001307 [Candidatus Accumulibacter phosphatis]
MYRQASDHAQRHRFVRRTCEGLLHALGQHLGHLQDGANAGVGAQHTVGGHGLPKPVVADEPRAIVGNLVTQDGLDLVAQGHQGAALLGEDQALEGADVVWVNGE